MAQFDESQRICHNFVLIKAQTNSVESRQIAVITPFSAQTKNNDLCKDCGILDTSDLRMTILTQVVSASLITIRPIAVIHFLKMLKIDGVGRSSSPGPKTDIS